MPTAELKGRRIAYETYGSEGPWVSIIHGGLAGAATWRPVANRLSRTTRLLTYDLRGYGGSDLGDGDFSCGDLAADLLALWDDVGLDHSVVLGFSLGGCIAQHLVELAPERLDGLLLESTTARLDPEAAESFLSRASTVEESGVEEDVSEHLQRAFSEGFRSKQPELVAQYADKLRDVDPQTQSRTFRALAEHDGRGMVAMARCPILIIRGGQDQTMHAEYVREIGELNSEARAVVLASAGHTIHIEAPSVFCHLVTDFVSA